MFVAMAALLVAALCVPERVRRPRRCCSPCAYAVVRVAQIALFVLASRDDPGCATRSGAGGQHAIGVGLLVVASFADGALQGGLWVLALALDMGGPLLSTRAAGGWRPATSPSATA